jgi:alanine-alpha-ketoisovalerate/valine-pyruvate aminotransferase
MTCTILFELQADGDSLVDSVVDLLRRRYGWTITKRER